MTVDPPMIKRASSAGTLTAVMDDPAFDHHPDPLQRLTADTYAAKSPHLQDY